jgi:CheY-like chemotaxis protein
VTQVLIVDDDAAIRETLRFILEDAGYTVLEECDGLGALQRLRRSLRPMVVLLDLMMPKLSGIGVLKEITSDDRLARHFAFILVTASDQTLPRSFTGLLASHAIPIIGKPWDIENLLKTVATAAEQIAGEEAR